MQWGSEACQPLDWQALQKLVCHAMAMGVFGGALEHMLLCLCLAWPGIA